jgi:hypothetical protein
MDSRLLAGRRQGMFMSRESIIEYRRGTISSMSGKFTPEKNSRRTPQKKEGNIQIAGNEVVFFCRQKENCILKKVNVSI